MSVNFGPQRTDTPFNEVVYEEIVEGPLVIDSDTSIGGGTGPRLYADALWADDQHDDTAAVIDIINRIQASANGGQIVWPPGRPLVTASLPTITRKDVSIDGPGSTSCIFDCAGVAGDLFRIQHPADSAATPAGFIRGFGVDMTHAGPNAWALHLGDISSLTIDDIQLLNQVSATGGLLWFDNQVFWTERIDVDRLMLVNAAKCVRYTVNGGTNSFGKHRYKDIRFNLNDGQVGMSIESGNLYDCWLNLLANINGSGANAGGIINMAGGTFTGEGAINAEQTSGAGAYWLKTAAAPVTSFTFRGGLTYGSLNAQLGGAGTLARLNGWTQINTAGGAVTIDAALGDYFEIKLTGNITSIAVINMARGQQLTLEFVQVAPGNFTLPATANWTVNGNPNFKFAGGAQPVWSVTSGFTDCVVFNYNGGNAREAARSLAVR